MSGGESRSGQLIVGMGVATGATLDEAMELVHAALAQCEGEPASILCIATLDKRLGHVVIKALADKLGVGISGFSNEQLEAVSVSPESRSGTVFAHSGTHSVAEAAALAAAGPGGRLLVGKIKSRHVTVAIAISPALF